MANALTSMIQREQDTDQEKRNALASDINWVTPNVGQVIPKWVSTSEVPWLERAYRDAKDVGDVVVRGALDIPNKLMMAVTDREAPAWALRNLTPAGQMVQGANQFAAGLRGTEVAENIWDQPEPLADAPWLQRAGNMATGIVNMALAYAPMEKAVGGAVGSIGAKVANKWPMQKGIYVGPKSKAWTTRPQVGLEGETVPEGAFSSLYDQKPRVEIDDSGMDWIAPKKLDVDASYNVDSVINHPKLFSEYPELKDLEVYPMIGGTSNFTGNNINIATTSRGTPLSGRKTMLHELQHAIQEREGFARGGSPSQFESDPELGNWLDNRERVEILQSSIKDIKSSLKDQPKKAIQYTDIYDNKDKWFTPKRAIEYVDKMEREIAFIKQRLPWMSPEEKYQRLAGEIEARDAAARAHMTMAERRATPPYSSENIPVSESIVRFDRNGPQEMTDAPLIAKELQGGYSAAQSENIPNTSRDIAGSGGTTERRLPAPFQTGFIENQGQFLQVFNELKKQEQRHKTVMDSWFSVNDPSVWNVAITNEANQIVPYQFNITGDYEKIRKMADPQGKIKGWKVPKELGQYSKSALSQLNMKYQKPTSQKNMDFIDDSVKEPNRAWDKESVKTIGTAPWSEKSGQIEGYVEGPERDANFKKWFGDSKVVDENGEPLVVYHGTTSEIDSFDPSKAGTVQNSDWGSGVYFTPSKWQADSYREEALKRTDQKANQLFNEWEQKAKDFGTSVMNASIDLGYGSDKYNQLREFENRWRKRLKEIEQSKDGNVIDAYLSLKNPMEYTANSMTDPFLAERAKQRGNDGIIIKREDGSIDELIAFSPTQIKSKFNRGTFDPKDPRILYGAGAGLAAYGATQDNKDVSDAPWLRTNENIK